MDDIKVIHIFNPDGVYTIPDVASELKTTRSSISNYVREGKIPHLKLGEGKKSSVRFIGRMLNEWLASRVREAELGNRPRPNQELDIRKKVNPRAKKAADCSADFNQFIEAKMKARQPR